MNQVISVILPFRNAAETLDDALRGLLADGDPALEVIAIDDGSEDGGRARAEAWTRKDVRVRVVQGPRQGLVAALRAGLDCARGGLIARMDADDICHPARLSRQRTFLAAHPRVGAAGTRVEAVAAGGSVGEGLLRYVAWQNGLLTPEDHRRERFVESPLCHPSVMMRRGAFEAVGGYRDTAGPEDYDLWLRLVAAGYELAKVPEVLLSWRHQAGRATFSDPRYAPERFRETKAPFLAAALSRMPRERRVLWGAGPTGRKLARELARHGLCFELIIDIDPDKLGRTLRGAAIASPDALEAGRDVVVGAVGARGARELIRAELEARGFREGEDAWFAA